MKITTAWLKRHRACQEQIVVFEAEWPDGLTLNRAAVERALELDLDLGWFGNVLETRFPARQDDWNAETDNADERWRKRAPAEYSQVETWWPRLARQTKACLAYKRAVATALIEMLRLA